MTKLHLIRFIFTIFTISSILGISSGEDYFDDTFGNDDDFQNNNAMINVRLYKTQNECVNQSHSLYYYHKNFNINCDCFKINSCFDKLKDSKKLNDFSFNFNNQTYNLDNLNFTKQCYNFRGVYIYNDLNIFQYCGSRIFLFVFIVIIIFSCIIANFSYFKHKLRKKKQSNKGPPSYQSIN